MKAQASFKNKQTNKQTKKKKKLSQPPELEISRHKIHQRIEKGQIL